MRIGNRIEMLKRSLVTISTEYDSLPRFIFDDSMLKKLSSAAHQAEISSLQQIFCNAAKVIYSNYGLKPRYSESSLSRPELFVTLSFLNSLFGTCIASDKFLMIDEGQDISLSEYRLWLGCYKETPIINVYGDVNQRIVNEYEGIVDWSYLLKQLGCNFRELYFNYRNTQQIVRYCQSVLNVSMKSVGLTGDTVLVFNESEIYSTLSGKLFSEDRVAVIYKSRSIHDKFLESCKLNEDSYILGDIKKGIISVLSVLEAKGLEFDTVLVLTAGMSKNELYISFTRALDRLLVFNRST